MNIRMAICEDNEKILKKEIEDFSLALASLNVTYTLDVFMTAEDFIASNTAYDIVVLDIELPQKSGIEVASFVRANYPECYIIFITEHEKYLDQAMDRRAFRFFKKPPEQERVRAALSIILTEIRNNQKHIEIVVKGEQKTICCNQILCVFMKKKRLIIATTKGEFNVNGSVQDFSNAISDSDMFGEPCRGYWVNHQYIADIVSDTVICQYRDRIYRLPVSRRKRKEFKEKFLDWMVS